jgi:uncharacterized protein
MIGTATVARVIGPVERERAVRALLALKGKLCRRGVAGLAVYGSLARREATEASDVDLVLTLRPDARFSLLDLSEVRLLASDRLGREASVVVDADLSPAFRAHIADDILVIY